MNATINGQKGKWVSTEGRIFGNHPWICTNHPDTKYSGTVTMIPLKYKYVFQPDPPEAEPETETLRDKFAMAALTGALARDIEIEGWDGLAYFTYEIADYMMEARKCQ